MRALSVYGTLIIWNLLTVGDPKIVKSIVECKVVGLPAVATRTAALHLEAL